MQPQAVSVVAELPSLVGRDGRPAEILVLAHGCHPERGSEDGAGWSWCRVLARLGRVTVITRADNREAIERVLDRLPERDNLQFHYQDLPAPMRTWTPDAAGKRAYYLLWQAAAGRLARRLSRDVDYDLTWHLTWSNAWIGSVLASMGRPFVWGPIGGGIGSAWGLAPSLGLKGCAYEGARAVVRGTCRYLNPLARQTWRRADLILASAPETIRWLPGRHRGKARLVHQALLADEVPSARQRQAADGPPTALFAGRLLAFKGGALALRALVHARNWRLIVCGDGPDEGRLRQLAHRLGLEDRVDFRGRLPRADVIQLMAERVDVLLFPSFHDESPATVLEAVTMDLPVVCLDRGGVPGLAEDRGVVVDHRGGVDSVARRLADALRSTEEPASRTSRSPGARRPESVLDTRAALLAPLLVPLLPTGAAFLHAADGAKAKP